MIRNLFLSIQAMAASALSGGLLSASPYGIPLSAVSQGQVSVGGLAASPMASHIAMAGGQIPGLAGGYNNFAIC